LKQRIDEPKQKRTTVEVTSSFIVGSEGLAPDSI
jgi:hypothetical protein